MFRGVVVVVLAIAGEGPKSVSRSSIPEEVCAVVLDGAPSSKSINDSSFLVEVEANSRGIGLAAAT